jgi:hypothetical protein
MLVYNLKAGVKMEFEIAAKVLCTQAGKIMGRVFAF